MTRFKRAVRGYDKKEVDEYVRKMNDHNEAKIHELEDCVERLKQENDYLYAKNAEYRRNEERVSGAILTAMEIKGNLEKELKTKIALEEDRLVAFKNKWTAFARGLSGSNADRVVDDVEAYVRDFRETFIKKANRDLNLKDEEDPAEKSFRKEKIRLARSEKKSPTISLEEKMSAASLFREESAAPKDSALVFTED